MRGPGISCVCTDPTAVCAMPERHTHAERERERERTPALWDVVPSGAQRRLVPSRRRFAYHLVPALTNGAVQAWPRWSSAPSASPHAHSTACNKAWLAARRPSGGRGGLASTFWIASMVSGRDGAAGRIPDPGGLSFDWQTTHRTQSPRAAYTHYCALGASNFHSTREASLSSAWRRQRAERVPSLSRLLLWRKHGQLAL